MTARIETGNRKKKNPQTRLAMAFPLVSAGVIAAGVATAGVTVAEAETDFPQAVQNFSFADRLLPQAEQSTRRDLPSLGVKYNRGVRRTSKRTVLFGFGDVNPSARFSRLWPHRFPVRVGPPRPGHQQPHRRRAKSQLMRVGRRWSEGRPQPS